MVLEGAKREISRLEHSLRISSSKVSREREYNLLEALHLLQMGRLLKLLLLKEVHLQLREHHQQVDHHSLQTPVDRDSC